MLNALKWANLGLAFALELCMLAAFAYWGARTGNGALAKVALGVGAPLVAVIVWGLFMAPRATFPLSMPIHTALFLVIFGAAALALARAGQPTLAVAFAVVSLLNYIVATVWR
ncbi:MAG TPA: YrdB family protein [Ktedonobacterales bacterium]|jgi:hypothetical protein